MKNVLLIGCLMGSLLSLSACGDARVDKTQCSTLLHDKMSLVGHQADIRGRDIKEDFNERGFDAIGQVYAFRDMLAREVYQIPVDDLDKPDALDRDIENYCNTATLAQMDTLKYEVESLKQGRTIQTSPNEWKARERRSDTPTDTPADTGASASPASGAPLPAPSPQPEPKLVIQRSLQNTSSDDVQLDDLDEYALHHPDVVEGIAKLGQQLNQQSVSEGRQPALDTQGTATLADAKNANQMATQMINATWKALPHDVRQQLLPAQRSWIAKRIANCRAEAASSSTNPKEQEIARLVCDTRETQTRIGWLNQYRSEN